MALAGNNPGAGRDILIGDIFSQPGPLWVVMKAKEINDIAKDDLRNVGDIVYIAKTEKEAKYAKAKRARGCYKVQLMWLNP